MNDLPPLAASQRSLRRVLLALFCLLCAAAAPSAGIYADRPIATTAPAATAAPGTTAPDAPATPDLPGGFGVTRVALALGFVLLVILALKLLAKKFLPASMSAGPGAVRLVSRTPLGPRQQVLLLHVGKRVVVVGDSAGRMSPLAEISDPDEVALLLGKRAPSADEEDQVAVEPSPFTEMFARRRAPYEEATRADAAVDGASQELGGLADRVRGLTAQFRRG